MVSGARDRGTTRREKDRATRGSFRPREWREWAIEMGLRGEEEVGLENVAEWAGAHVQQDVDNARADRVNTAERSGRERDGAGLRAHPGAGRGVGRGRRSEALTRCNPGPVPIRHAGRGRDRGDGRADA